MKKTIVFLISACFLALTSANAEATTRQEDATNMFMEVQDKYNIICRQMYLESPIRDILFEGWTEEEIQSLMEYDPVVMEIRKAIKNSPLCIRFPRPERETGGVFYIASK